MSCHSITETVCKTWSHLFIIASLSNTRNILGRLFPSWGQGVTDPTYCGKVTLLYSTRFSQTPVITHLDKTKSDFIPGGHRFTVFVQTSCKTNRRRKGKSKNLWGLNEKYRNSFYFSVNTHILLTYRYRTSFETKKRDYGRAEHSPTRRIVQKGVSAWFSTQRPSEWADVLSLGREDQAVETQTGEKTLHPHYGDRGPRKPPCRLV